VLRFAPQDADKLARELDYSVEELKSLPKARTWAFLR